MSESNSLTLGFIGLGAMGGPMANNIQQGGHPLYVYDAADTAKLAPTGALICRSVADLAAKADIVLTSLPDGHIVQSVVGEILATNQRRTRAVLDTSTIGLAQAEAVSGLLANAGLGYADAPVSGGVSGAKKASIALMYSGPGELLEELRPALSCMSKNIFHVGEEPGQGQAMKLLNNFLSGLAMAASCEAIAFGAKQGLDMSMMIDVLNASTGQNTATLDKFPNRILTESYDAGFTSRLMVKDVGLFLEATEKAGSAHPFAPGLVALWRKLEERQPNTDITRMYPFVVSGECDQ